MARVYASRSKASASTSSHWAIAARASSRASRRWDAVSHSHRHHSTRHEPSGAAETRCSGLPPRAIVPDGALGRLLAFLVHGDAVPCHQ